MRAWQGIILFVTAVAFILTAVALYSRFSQSNVRFAEAQAKAKRQAEINVIVTSATRKNTCAIRAIILTGERAYKDEASPQSAILENLGVTPTEKSKIVAAVHEANVRALKLLPPVTPACPPLPR